MTIKSRADLKAFFGTNYSDLIDSELNQADDGVFKVQGEPLSVVAAATVPKPVLRLYTSFPATSPDWLISLNPAQDPTNTATCRPGFGITDAAGNPRLFVDAASGRIGIATNTPQYRLDVAGGVRANGFRGLYNPPLADYRTAHPASSVCLYSPGNDRDAWLYLDSADTTSNWGIYHRQIDSGLAGLPANSIGFIGGGNSKLQAYVNLGDGSAFFAGVLRCDGELQIGATIRAPGRMHITGGELCYLLHKNGVIVGKSWGGNGNLNVEGDVAVGGKHAFRGSDSWLRLNQDSGFASGVYTPGVLRCDGELHIGATIRAPGRMHLTGEELCYLLHKSGVIISKSWGGNGNLTVEGDIAVSGSWVKVAGAGSEQTYFGGDGVSNDVQIGSTKAGVTTVSAWNWANGWMDVAGRNWLGHSDERSKENIEPVVGVLEKLLQLRCVSFDWKGESGAQKKAIGLVAQEVSKVLPEVVSELRHGSLAISYNSITALLVEAIKEQQKQIDELRAALAEAHNQRA